MVRVRLSVVFLLVTFILIVEINTVFFLFRREVDIWAVGCLFAGKNIMKWHIFIK